MGRMDLTVLGRVLTFNFRWAYGRQDFGARSATDTLEAGRTTFALVDGGV